MQEDIEEQRWVRRHRVNESRVVSSLQVCTCQFLPQKPKCGEHTVAGGNEQRETKEERMKQVTTVDSNARVT